jgi:Helix-turn-helix domain
MAPLLTPVETGKILGVDTLKLWRYRKEGPDYIKVGAQVRYSEAALAAYLEAQTVRAAA